MRLFNKVAIVGTGLIGGSIALAIKKKGLAGEVIGVSRHKKSLALAKKKKAIDRGSQDFAIVKDADLLIFATPVDAILKAAPKIRRIISKGCIVSDVGSTKREIASRLEKLFPNYIGSHPLAGSEKRGIVNAQPHLFEDSLCILTTTNKTKGASLRKIKLLWRRLGARTLILTPSLHDKILSFTSHLPHILAFSLIGVIPRKFLRFASGGLRDTTRIAASSSELWPDILLSNRKNILKDIELFEAQLSRLKAAVRRKDKETLKIILEKAKRNRDYLDGL